MRNKIVIACLAIIIPGFLFLITGCESTSPLTAQQASHPTDKVDASGLFMEHCETCHSRDGRAQTFRGRLVGAQNLTDPKWQTNTTDDLIINTIEKGSKAMPAFEKKLSSSEIHALAAYVRSFKPVPQEAPR